jgi:DNA-binding NarL/FixJ family response regulator
VRQAVALYAAGYSQADLVNVLRAVANQGWAKDRGLGSLLSFKVVEANRPKPLAKTEANLSPRAAAVLARVREGRTIRETG